MKTEEQKFKAFADFLNDPEIEMLKKQLKVAMNALLYFSNLTVYEDWEVEGRAMEKPILINGYDIAYSAVQDIAKINDEYVRPDETTEVSNGK